MQTKPKTPNPELTDFENPELGEDFWRRAVPARERMPSDLNLTQGGKEVTPKNK